METHISQTDYVRGILDLLTSIAEKMTLDFAPYIPLIQKAIRRNKLIYEKFDNQVEFITKINPILLFKENMDNALYEEQQELM